MDRERQRVSPLFEAFGAVPMSRENAQTVGFGKFGLMLALLAALAVIATLGSQWEQSTRDGPQDAAVIVPAGLSLPAAPAQADILHNAFAAAAETTVFSLVDVPSVPGFERQVVATSPENAPSSVSARQVTTASPDLADTTATSNNSGLHLSPTDALFGSTVTKASNYSTEEANALYALVGGQPDNGQVAAANGSVFESPAFTSFCSSCVEPTFNTIPADGAITPTGSRSASFQAVTEGLLCPASVLGLTVFVLVLGCMLIPAQRYGFAPSLSALVVKGRISKRFGAPILPSPA